MNSIFWAIPNILAGRPGPNMQPWDPVNLYDQGIRSILTTNLGEEVDPATLHSAGLVHEHFYFPIGEPPDSEQFEIGLEVLPLAYRWYCTAPKPMLVHCSAGKDRTGLFIAYVLMLHDSMNVEEAMKNTREIRPIAFTATGWESFVFELLSELSSRA